jgi:phosphotransferase system HPr (HPr) family protein
MSVAKLTRTVTIVNRQGVHARFAILIAQLVRRFDAQVTLCKDAERVQGTDVLQILSFCAAEQGEQLTLEATGPEAEAALSALVDLFANYVEENDNSSAAPKP